MRKFLVPVIILICFGAIIGLYFHDKGESEKEKESPITVSSKVVPRTGMTPVLELPVKFAESAGIEVIQLPVRNGRKDFRFPLGAIIREEDRMWVYLKLSDTQYSRLEVEPVTNSEQGSWRLIENLPNSAVMTVVSVGAQLLLSEELKSQIQVGESGG